MPNPQRFIRFYVDLVIAIYLKSLVLVSITPIKYKEWCNENGESKTFSNNKFSMEIKQFAFRTCVRYSGNLTHCYILDRAKIAKKFDESFNIISEQKAQSDYKEGNSKVKVKSSKTKIPETEKKDLTKKKETLEGKLSVQTKITC
jgi:hypothetical protein